MPPSLQCYKATYSRKQPKKNLSPLKKKYSYVFHNLTDLWDLAGDFALHNFYSSTQPFGADDITFLGTEAKGKKVREKSYSDF